MQAKSKIEEAWFVFPARPEKANGQPQPITLSDRLMKLLKITQWSDLLAEGDDPYFGF